MAELKITIRLAGETEGSPEIWPDSIPVREMLARLVLEAQSTLADEKGPGQTWSLVLVRTNEPLRLDGTLLEAGVRAGDTIVLEHPVPDTPAEGGHHPAVQPDVIWISGEAAHIPTTRPAIRASPGPTGTGRPAPTPSPGTYEGPGPGVGPPTPRRSIFKMTTAELMEYLRSLVRSKPGPTGAR